MSGPSLDELRTAWTSRAAATRVAESDARHRAALRLLAEGRPVAAGDIAATTGEPVAEVAAWLVRMQAAGYELDGQARLVGAALTLRPTAHRLRVAGSDLYAWCGFDTLFLPILLDTPAEVVSTCPATGRPIHLDVAADGTVTAADPGTTVVGVVGPAVLERCDAVGPGSAVCSQMPLLADPDAARDWATGRDGVAIVDLDTAAELARAYAGRGGCC